MRFFLIPVLITSLFFSQSPTQAPPADSRALQSILEEVQKLRQDIRATAATIQRAQLLLYRMRLQMDSVSRVSQRVEQAHAELEQFKYQRTMAEKQLKYWEDQRDRAADSTARSQADDQLGQIKQWMEQAASRESDAQAREAEFTGQLRFEEAKLDDLQRQFDALDRKLEMATQVAPSR